MKQRVSIVLPFVCAFALVAPASARDQLGAIWTGGGGNAFWWTPANWNNNTVPNNAGGNTWWVVTHPGPVGNGSVITITQATTIDKMGIAATDTVRQANGVQFTVIGQTDNKGFTGLFGGAGSFFMEGTNLTTDFRIGGPANAFLVVGNSQQPGLWQITNNNNRVYGLAGTNRLVVDENYVIRGAGQIGINQMRLTNYGIFDATAADSMTINVAGSDNFNLGTFQASEGATLSIQNSIFSVPAVAGSGSSTILAKDASFVHISNCTLPDHTFNTEGSGIVRMTGATTIINPVNLGRLDQNNGVQVTVEGPFLNQSVYNMNGSNLSTDFRLNTPEVTLTGGGSGGVMNLSNSDNNRLYGINATRRLINAADHVIRGSGQIGINNAFNLTNEGLIQADQPSALTIDLSAGENFNNSLMQATNGATLNIFNTTLDNTEGVLLAKDASVINFSNTTLIAGEMATEGSGEIRLIGATNLHDASLNGRMVINNGVQTTLHGDVIHNNVIDVNGTNLATDVRLNTPIVTFTGGGVMNLSNSVNNRIYGINATRRLVNAADHVIRGAGQIGINNAFNLTNDGVIQADQPSSLTIDLSAGENVNNNLIQAINGALIIINNTALTNAESGVIHVGDESRIDIASSSITGGALTAAGTGFFRMTAVSTLWDITLDTRLDINNGVSPVFLETITNNGVLNMNGSNLATDLRLNSPIMTLDGDGELVLSNTVNNRIYGINATRRLVNGLNHTIRGAGQIGINNSFNLTNMGSIVADASAGMTIDVTNDFTNEGLLHVKHGNVTIAPGAFTTSGTVLVDEGRTLTRDGHYVQTGGETALHGALSIVGGGVCNLQSGVLKGTGPLNATAVNNTGAHIEPGFSIGHMVINANLTQSGNGVIAIEIGGPIPFADHDVLSVNGTASIGGTLAISFVDGYKPAPSTVFTVMSASSRSGEFANVIGDGAFSVIYRSHTVSVVYEGPAPPNCPADLNDSGAVDVQDLLMLLGAWGPCGKGPGSCPADLNDSSAVDVQDLLILLGAWGPCP